MQASLSTASNSYVPPRRIDMCLSTLCCLSGADCDTRTSICSCQVATINSHQVANCIPSFCRTLLIEQLWYMASHSFLYRLVCLKLSNNPDLCSGAQVNKIFWEKHLKELFGQTCPCRYTLWSLEPNFKFISTVYSVLWVSEWCNKKWLILNAAHNWLPQAYQPVIKCEAKADWKNVPAKDRQLLRFGWFTNRQDRAGVQSVFFPNARYFHLCMNIWHFILSFINVTDLHALASVRNLNTFFASTLAIHFGWHIFLKTKCNLCNSVQCNFHYTV